MLFVSAAAPQRKDHSSFLVLRQRRTLDTAVVLEHRSKSELIISGGAESILILSFEWDRSRLSLSSHNTSSRKTTRRHKLPGRTHNNAFLPLRVWVKPHKTRTPRRSFELRRSTHVDGWVHSTRVVYTLAQNFLSELCRIFKLFGERGKTTLLFLLVLLLLLSLQSRRHRKVDSDGTTTRTVCNALSLSSRSFEISQIVLVRKEFLRFFRKKCSKSNGFVRWRS